MNQPLRRVRGTIGMGLTWAVTWVLGGLLIGVTTLLFPGSPLDAFFEVFDAPLPVLAIPGFIGGALFSVVLGIAGRRQRFDELSLPRFAAWGALAGLILGALPFVLGTPTNARPLWALALVVIVPMILLSAGSAAGSLALARRAAHPPLLGAGANVPEVGHVEDETPTRLERRR